MSYYVDVHTHLTHDRFSNDLDEVILRAKEAGLGAVVVNGLEPYSNRQVLNMNLQNPVIKPALGIYPIDAVGHLLPQDFPFEVPLFDLEKEIEFIEEMARAGRIAAIGECGLDGHWLSQETFAAQEKVLEQLLDIAIRFDLPAILHSRSLEGRTIEILRHMKVKKVNMHCFGGKTKLAQKVAEDDGFYFSIPSNATKSESFQKLLKSLPLDKILTETDAPYLAPTKGTRNEPSTVIGTVSLLATYRGLAVEEARDKIYGNYKSLFGEKWS